MLTLTFKCFHSLMGSSTQQRKCAVIVSLRCFLASPPKMKQNLFRNMFDIHTWQRWGPLREKVHKKRRWQLLRATHLATGRTIPYIYTPYSREDNSWEKHTWQQGGLFHIFTHLTAEKTTPERNTPDNREDYSIYLHTLQLRRQLRRETHLTKEKTTLMIYVP